MKRSYRGLALVAATALAAAVAPVATAPPAHAACAITGAHAVFTHGPNIVGSTALIYGAIYMETSGCSTNNPRVVEGVFTFRSAAGVSTPVSCIPNPIYNLNVPNGARCITGDPIVGLVPTPGVAVSAPDVIVAATGVAAADTFIGTCNLSYNGGVCYLA